MSSPGSSKETPAIFSGVNFFLSRGLPTSTSERTKELLIEHGALEAENMKEATHVISSSNCFIGANETKGATIVTPTWVERSVILGKQQDHRYYSADPRMIFSGIIATSSDLPKQDSESIASGIMAFGGQWKEALTNDVTHMFCLSASGPKYAKALENQNNPISVQVVVPHWFEHSFKAESLLSVKNYLFPNPPILDPDFNEKNILDGNPGEAQDGHDAAKSRALLRAAAKMEDPSSTSNTQPTSSNRSAFSNYVLAEKRVVFSSGAVQNEPSRDSIYRRRVEQVGGTYISGLELGEGGISTEVLENADIFITLYRDNEEYELAAKTKVIIGTPAWILYITNTGLWSAPQEHLLHYPFYEKPVPGFEDQVITITNYTGDAREYLKKLIAAVGGKFTPSMTSKNTCVIASHVSIPPDQTKQNKITKARQWRLPIVNHLWLEDSFREWTKMPLSDRKYTEFPPGHDWMQDINARGIGTAPMPAPPKQDPPPMTDNTNVALNSRTVPTEKPVSAAKPPSTIKPTSTVKSTPARRKSDTAKQTKAPASTGDASSKTPSKADGTKRKNNADTSQSAKRPKTNAKDSNVSPAKSVGDFPSVASSSSFVKSLSAVPHGIPVKLLSPEKDRRKPRKSSSDDEDSDNQDDDSSSSTSEPPTASKSAQPSTSMGMGGRKPRAAAAAAQNILRNVIMPDVQKFQNEMSSSRGDVRKMEQLAEKKQRRASMAGHDNDGAPPAKKKRPQPEDENDKPGSKKTQAAKSSQGKTEQKPRTSNFQPAIRIVCSKAKPTESAKKALEKLGAHFTNNPSDCTHLVVNSISRTEKFLCAFPRCTYVITMDWIEESAKAGKLLQESAYKLSDPDNEKGYSMNLARSMERIRKNGGELFKGHTFFLTDKVGVDFDSLERVIQSSGGVAKLETKPTKKKLGNDMRHHHVISSNEAKPSWQALVKEGIPIYSKEFVLNSVLRQELDWNADRIV